MKPKKHTRFDLQNMKAAGQKAVWITAYDCWTASFAERAGMDMILVGDSLGMCVYGYSGTVPVTMDQCIWHSEAVRRGAGWEADGQLMICSDVLGIFQALTPKFVKKYENLGAKTIEAFKQYVQDARSGEFPKEEHAYKMVEGELPKLEKLLAGSE